MVLGKSHLIESTDRVMAARMGLRLLSTSGSVAVTMQPTAWW
jgi:hypothetical protein